MELIVKNYKEPLKPVPKSLGFGYYGAVTYTKDGTGIQCHVCGKVFEALGEHVRHKHGMNVREYKEKFMLSPMTGLISESERQARKERTLVWIEKMKKEYGNEWRVWLQRNSKKGRHTRGNVQPTISLETKNKRGTCPDQLIAKILEVKEHIGHTPSLADFIRETGGQKYKHLIFTTFGSWKKALSIAGLVPKENVRSVYRRYGTDELLEYLALYAREYGKIPTAADSKIGAIPGYDIYIKRFGSMDKARELAGVYDIVPKETLRGLTN